MNVRAKMLHAYFRATEALLNNPSVTGVREAFHRTKKYAFFIDARRLGKDGLLPGETKAPE